MTLLSNGTLTTLQTVYYDDYDEDKQYHRLLFRPATAVQARELTQLQTILQNQIQRLSTNIFKDGSIVDGCAVTYLTKLPFVRVTDTFTTNTSLSVTSIDNTYLITNGTTANAVRAIVKVSKQGYETTYPDTNIFYLDYIRTGKSGGNDVKEFANGDTLYVYSSSQDRFGNLVSGNLVDTINVYVSNATTNSVGYGYGVSVTDGILYQKGFFSKIEPQTLIVKKYDTNPNNYVVGFETTETIITENQDSTLNDNASGFYNYNAPGAHRLKLTPTLVAKTRSDSANNKNFFAIVEFDGDKASEQKTDPVYNKLGDEFATRTREESGDYVVKPFQVDTYSASSAANLIYEVSPGTAYVQGYRVELIGSKTIEAPRAYTTDFSQNQIVTANYGNYVVVDEMLGRFDFMSAEQVDLYDTAQNSVSDVEALGSASGTSIGKANVRAVQYFTGTKGTPTGQYLVYLFNIVMTVGKSFSDVKSIITSNGKADIVLENDKAVLKDSNMNTLVYLTGVDGVRRLTSSGGTYDTSYYFRQSSNGTLSTAGGITFSSLAANSAGSGELLGYGVGQVSAGNEGDFLISFGSNSYTSNLSGTVTVTSGSNTITGTSSLFTTNFKIGDTIRITGTGGSPAYYSISAINSNTSMSIVQTPGTSYTANTYQKFFLGGTLLDPVDTTISIDVGQRSFVVNTNFTFDSVGTGVMVGQYTMNRSQTSISFDGARKQIKKNRLVKIDCSNNVTSSSGPWDLGFVDVAKINHVWIGSSGSYSNTSTDRATWFTLDNGQRDDVYDHAKLFVKPSYASQITTTTTLLVDLDYFLTDTSSGAGYYSVDSYPVSNTANSTTISYAEIPFYKGIDLRNAIDFRFQKTSSATDVANTNPANNSISINPAVSGSTFNVSSGTSLIAEPDSNFTADVEYYLPRRDLIVINKNGDLAVRSGTPKNNPAVPFNERDTTVLAEVYVPPFPSLTVREGDTYKRKDISTKISIKTTRGYTMKDIAALEERIKRLEYYTVLNALEQQARDLTIPDTNGLNRFKNGIFADPFNSHNIGNVSDFEYKIAIDPSASVARPYFTKHDVDFKYSSANSTNITKTGNLLTLPYTHELYISQRFASKFRNTTGLMWSWNGSVDLYPSYDYYRDEVNLPSVNITLDLTAPWDDFANSPFGTVFGDWNTVSTVSNSTSTTSGSTTTTTTTTASTQQSIVQSLQVDTLTQTYNLGSYVNDISIQPYMRSRIVAFVAYNMKPNTLLHAFFDDTPVDQYVAPGTLNGSYTGDGLENDKVTQSGAYGDALVSDDNGFICGLFKIPAATFRVGDRVFRITDVDNLVTGSDAIITSGSATYSASNMTVTTTGATITTLNPDVSVISNTVNRVVTTTRTRTSTRAPMEPPAQSFFVEVPGNTSGIFLTKVGVYFKSKDPNLGVTCFISEMQAGFPDTTRIVGKGYLSSSAVSVSDTAASETVFTLDQPVMLTAGLQYAFIIYPDGNSPEYRLWFGETGGYDIASGEQIYSNPYSGIAFISANFNTWTALQKEDIKFNIYRAKFSQSTGTATFYNEDDEYLTINSLTRANSSIAVEIGDVVYTANASTNAAITGSSNAYGVIQYVDEGAGKFYLDSTRPGFTSNSAAGIPRVNIYRVSDPTNTSLLTTSNMIAYGNVSSVDNFTYSVVVPKFASIEPLRTQLAYKFKGTKNNYTVDSGFTSVINETHTEYIDQVRIAVSRSNENTSMSDAKSSTFEVNFVSENDLVSPAIDLSKKASIFVENIINNDSTNEHTRYGNASTKYVSKRVVLADGQEAEDLLVYMTAYRPVGTDVEVYVKFRNAADRENFDSKIWTKLDYKNDSNLVYSDPLNVSNFIEYEFELPTTSGAAYGGTAQTVNSNSSIIEEVTIAFNSNTAVDATNEFITLTSNPFVNNDIVRYLVAAGNTALTNLTNNSIYYVVGANSTGVKLASSLGGSAIDLTKGVTESGHSIKGVGGFISFSSVNTQVFNANTDVDATNEFISIASNPFANNDTVRYLVAAGNTALTNLSNNSIYYVVGANTTGVKLALTSGGSAINLTKGVTESGHSLTAIRANEFANGEVVLYNVAAGNTALTNLANNTLYYVVAANTSGFKVASTLNGTPITIAKGLSETGHTITGISYRAFSNTSTGVLQYMNNAGEIYYDGYKEYAVKIVLLSDNKAVVPRLNDVRAIALQV